MKCFPMLHWHCQSQAKHEYTRKAFATIQDKEYYHGLNAVGPLFNSFCHFHSFGGDIWAAVSVIVSFGGPESFCAPAIREKILEIKVVCHCSVAKDRVAVQRN